MNKKRNIYRGINKRKSQASAAIGLLVVVTMIAGGYKVVEKYDQSILKNIDISSITNKLKLKKDNTIFTSKDIEKEIKELTKEDEKNTENNDKKSESSDSSVATINAWNIYSIQIASISNDNKLEEIQSSLLEKNIPFSVLKNGDVSKIHTQSYVNENDSRERLNEIKKEFPDAFLTKIEVPIVSFEYTTKYEYINEIANELNKLIITFESESEFWAGQSSNVNYSDYVKIINERKSIQDNILKNTQKIEYKALDELKENLTLYIKTLDNNLAACQNASKSKNWLVCQSLFISSMQGYYNFIEAIK